MPINDVDTTGKYCPINGFNPPCRLCMFAIESVDGKVACAVSVIAKSQHDDVYVKNVVSRIKEVE